jgi:hypothetical protein
LSDFVPKPDYDLSYDLYWHSKGLSPEEKGAMERAELSEDEAQLWASVGIDCPKVAWGWKSRHVSPDEAGHWHDAGFLPNEADALRDKTLGVEDVPLTRDERREARSLGLPLNRAYWFKCDGGISVAQAAEWADLPFKPNPSIAAAWIREGFSPREATAWWEDARISDAAKAADWRAAEFDPQSVVPWSQPGFTAESAGLLRNLGLTPTDDASRRLRGREAHWLERDIPLAEAVPWARAGYGPRDAAQWRQAGFDAASAEAWQNKARKPNVPVIPLASASLWRELHVTLEQARALSAKGVSAHTAKPWVEAGFSPRAALTLKRAGLQMAKSLRDLGLDVSQILAWAKSGQASRAAEWIAAGVHAPKTAKGWKAARVSARNAGPWAAAGFSPTDAGKWRKVCSDPTLAAKATRLGLTPAEWKKRIAHPAPGEARIHHGPSQRVKLFWGIPFPESQDRAPWSDTRGPWREAWPTRYVLESGGKAVADSGCFLGRYGAVARSEYEFPFAAVANSSIEVNAFGGVAPLPVGPEWAERLREFCDILGLPYSEPTWHLTAYWECA